MVPILMKKKNPGLEIGMVFSEYKYFKYSYFICLKFVFWMMAFENAYPSNNNE